MANIAPPRVSPPPAISSCTQAASAAPGADAAGAEARRRRKAAAEAKAKAEAEATDSAGTVGFGLGLEPAEKECVLLGMNVHQNNYPPTITCSNNTS